MSVDFPFDQAEDVDWNGGYIKVPLLLSVLLTVLLESILNNKPHGILEQLRPLHLFPVLLSGVFHVGGL